MKKTIYLITATLLFTLAVSASRAATVANVPLTKVAVAAMTPEQKQARFAEIKQRIGEIRAMDKSKLAKPERKELRAELRGLRKEATSMYDVLYIGVGALVVLILILILIAVLH